MGTLTVYKASAGTGKTFRLAVDYIKLLISNPQAYKSILAVTFTNKATEEMKTRILSQLYGIWKRLPDSNDYMERIVEELGVSEEQASQQAAKALRELIHNYSYFRVETIDAFFQGVLRNLARELDLTANLRIALNDEQVEEQAVDDLIDSLNNNSQELAWILDYINESIDNDKSWNVIGQIKQFGNNIFKDVYRAHGDKINEVLHSKDFFQQYTKMLRSIRDDAADTMKKYADTFFDALDRYQVGVDDFSNRAGGPAGYFIKLRDGKFYDEKIVGKRITDAIEDPSTWVKAADRNDASPAYRAVNDVIGQLLIDAEKERPRQAKLYKSATLTLRHMNQLRLLDSIATRFNELNNAQNRFMLSETQSLLSELIADSDSPFIFEKIGSQLNHIMIDEFQDTSTIQWKNFKVLLKECMSHHDSKNLIVGDVKQSIYRWRSGDWRLLNDIEHEFPASQMVSQPLSVNYRSSRRMIDFNNAFFNVANKEEYKQLVEGDSTEADQLTRAYKGLKQVVPNKLPDSGYVRVELLTDDDYHNETLKRIKGYIEELHAIGVEDSKIAILVRSNRTIRMIGEYLMEEMPNVRLVSSEAFWLDASDAVNILVRALYTLVNQQDLLGKATLCKLYQRQVLKTPLRDDELFADLTKVDDLLPSDYVNHFDDLLTMPLFELVERLFDIFQISRLNDESAYVCAFFDQLSQFLNENITDIQSFLDMWDETIHKKSIQSDSADGIRLLTIHKSKGLEFDHVILPFCDWRLEQAGSLIWCELSDDAKPFNQLPLVPVDFSASQMKGSVYEPDYQHEHLQNMVDNLNLLYVAFTRAKDSMFVVGKRGNSSGRSLIIEKCLADVAKELPGSQLSGFSEDDGQKKTKKKEKPTNPVHFEYGCLAPKAKKEKEETKNVFLQPSLPVKLNLESFPVQTSFKQSNQSRDFIKGDDEEERQKMYLNLGNILHNLFSSIRSADDIPAAITRLEEQGVLYGNELTRQKLVNMIDERLHSPKVADWFSARWQVFNECTILEYNPEEKKVVEHRPDRVITDGQQFIVIDFKFGKPNGEYETQVRRYMSTLKSMGYEQVQGYLWYVYSNKTQEVFLDSPNPRN